MWQRSASVQSLLFTRQRRASAAVAAASDSPGRQPGDQVSKRNQSPGRGDMGSSLRRGTILSLILLGVCLATISIAQAQSTAGPSASIQWRRTVNGWERADLWPTASFSNASATQRRENGPTAPLAEPGIHPIFVAALMLCAAGLLAIGAGQTRT